jgi:hypothetical protein
VRNYTGMPDPELLPRSNVMNLKYDSTECLPEGTRELCGKLLAKAGVAYLNLLLPGFKAFKIIP